MSNAEYLLSIFWKAADKDAAFAQYLYDKVQERLAGGRSTDSDEYRALLNLAGK